MSVRKSIKIEPQRAVKSLMNSLLTMSMLLIYVDNIIRRQSSEQKAALRPDRVLDRFRQKPVLYNSIDTSLNYLSFRNVIGNFCCVILRVQKRKLSGCIFMRTDDGKAREGHE